MNRCCKGKGKLSQRGASIRQGRGGAPDASRIRMTSSVRIAWIQDDELVEVTAEIDPPGKCLLDPTVRKRADKSREVA